MIVPVMDEQGSYFGDDSDEPLAIRNLDATQKERLGELLEVYMEGLESGLPPTVQSLTVGRPELREALEACVSGLESLHQLNGPGDASRKSTLLGEADDPGLLGDFQLHEEIGRGGMGVVYRATQKSLRRDVAIKLLPLTSVLDPRRVTRFRQEAEAAATLMHPNIVPVFATGCERGVHFYAMRYIEGKSLDEMPPYDDWRVAVQHAAEIADGLHAAHEFGIIHRDVKPSNVIVDRQGKPWITDFGLARIQGDASLTTSGDVIGTMRYMSPEQALGDSAIIDGRTDIYSLGATLYEMLAGCPAHDAEDAPAVVRQIDSQAITPLTKLRPDLPSDLATVVSKAMGATRDDRYESAAAFAADLRRLLAGEPTVARPPTLLDHCFRWATRYRIGVSVTVVIVLLALVSFMIGSGYLATQRRIADENARLALANEVIAREAIDRLGNQMAELLEDIPAANQVRQRLLLETLGYYQALVGQSQQATDRNREHELDLAITHGKIGVFQGELGQPEDAVKSLRRSEELLQRLASRFPEDVPLQLQWSISQNNLARQFADGGDFLQATDWFGKALANQKRLRATEAVTAEFAATLNNFGQMLVESGNMAEAETVLSRSLEVLAPAGQSEATLQATVQANLAGLLAQRDPDRAAELAAEAITARMKMLKDAPGNAKSASAMVGTLNTLAVSQVASSKYTSAIETLRQALQICRELRARWPEQPSYRRDLGITLNQLGLTYAHLGRDQQAFTMFRDATEQARQLVKAYPENAEARSMLASVLNNAGLLQRKQSKHKAARLLFSEAVREQHRAVALAPQVPRYQRLLEKQERNMEQRVANHES